MLRIEASLREASHGQAAAELAGRIAGPSVHLLSARLKPALGGCATAILDAWEEDLRRGEVGTGAAQYWRLIYRLKNGITPPDGVRLRHKNYKPAEYADVILG